LRRWGKSDSEATEYYNRLMKESEGMKPWEREMYMTKRIMEYVDDMV